MIKPAFNSGRALGFFWEVFQARPTAFLVLAVWTLAYTVGMGLFQIQFMGDEIIAFANMDPNAEPSEVFATLGGYFAKVGLISIAGMAFYALFEAAWYRLFLFGQSGGLFPFRLGRDELLTLVGVVIMAVVFIGGYLVALVPAAILIGVFSLAGPAGAVLGGVVALAGIIWFFASLLVATLGIVPLSIKQGKIAAGGAMSGALKVYWPVLGTIVLCFIIMMVVMMVGMIGFLFLPVGLDGLHASGRMATPAELLLPFAVLYAIMLVPASIYRGIGAHLALSIDEADQGGAPAPESPPET